MKRLNAPLQAAPLQAAPVQAAPVQADAPARAEVVPALRGRPLTAPADRVGPRLTFAQRATRPMRFPLEQSLARIPEPPRLGRYLDIEV